MAQAIFKFTPEGIIRKRLVDSFEDIIEHKGKQINNYRYNLTERKLEEIQKKPNGKWIKIKN